MALKLALTDDTTGATFPAAYQRVSGLSVDALRGRITVHLATYADADCAKNGKGPVATSNLDGDYAAIIASSDPNDVLGRAYTWLAAQPTYEKAESV